MTIYEVIGHDNGEYVLTKCSGAIRCPACGVALNKYELDYSEVGIRWGRWDVSATYDGFTIVSPRFAAVCAEHGFQGYDIKPLDEGGFVFLAKPTLRVDVERSKLRFDEYCETCKRFNSVAAGIQTPVFVTPAEEVKPNSFYRTDVVFAWRDEQSPMELCGEEVANVLRKSKLRGLVVMKKYVSLEP